MKTKTFSRHASATNGLMFFFFLLFISDVTIAANSKKLAAESGLPENAFTISTSTHRDIRLPNDLDDSTRKKLKTSIEKKLMIKIDKVLDNKNNVTLNAIEVTVDVNGIVAVTKVKGKNLPQDIVTAITRIVERQDYSKFKMLYFWKYVIEY